MEEYNIKETYSLFLERLDELTDRQIVVFLYEQMGQGNNKIAKRRKLTEQMVKHDKIAINRQLHCIRHHDDIVAFLIHECFSPEL